MTTLWRILSILAELGWPFALLGAGVVYVFWRVFRYLDGKEPL